jgi:lipopolysaccharide transport system permease protein
MSRGDMPDPFIDHAADRVPAGGQVMGHRSAELTVIRPRTSLFDFEFGTLWRYRELLYFLVWRDLKVRYSQAALGAVWVVLQPLLAVTVFTVVFGFFAKIPSDGLPFALFVFAAILPWTYFSEASRRSAIGLLGDADLVRKVYFPRLIIPIANVVSPLIDFFVGLLVLFAMMAWFGVWPNWSIVFFPVFLVLVMGLALCFGLWLGPINVKYHDIMHTLPFLLQVWMYATPVVYPLSLVPENLRVVYSLNPTVGIIEGFRWTLLGRGEVDVTAIVISGVMIAVGLFGGLVFFKRAERGFADII